MTPGVRRKLPATVFHCISNILSSLFILRNVVVGFCISEIGSTVSENAVIAGQRNNTFRSVVREVRVFFHEFVEQRNKVVVASVSLSVGICVLMQYFIAFQDESIRKSVALHIFVVRQVIKREDQRLLAFRQLQGLVFYAAIGVSGIQIVRAHQNVIPVVHLLNNLIELINGDHVVKVAGRIFVSVKSSFGVSNQRMKEQMGHVGVIVPRHQVSSLTRRWRGRSSR